MRSESSNRPSTAGLVCRQGVRSRLEAALAACGALTSMALTFAAVAFVQARPNVPILPADSKFDGERSFSDLRRGQLRAQAARIPSLGTEPRIHCRRTPRGRRHCGPGLLHRLDAPGQFQ